MRCPRCNSQTVSLVPAAARLFCDTCARWSEIPVRERMWLEPTREPAPPVNVADAARSA